MAVQRRRLSWRDTGRVMGQRPAAAGILARLASVDPLGSVEQWGASKAKATLAAGTAGGGTGGGRASGDWPGGGGGGGGTGIGGVVADVGECMCMGILTARW